MFSAGAAVRRRRVRAGGGAGLRRGYCARPVRGSASLYYSATPSPRLTQGNARRLRETARRVCVAFAPHLPPVCRYHAHAFGVDRARVAFAVASLAGGGISLDARPAPFSCAPALLELLDEDGGERAVR